MEITFPNHVMPKVTALGTVSFQAAANGEYLWCEISCEALRDRFGALSMDENDLLHAFHSGRMEIEQVAQRNLEANSGHAILLRAVDF